MSDVANAEAREYLRHALATLAYRGGKLLRGGPPGFAVFAAGETSRTPLQILAHIADLFEWARSLARGEEAWRESSPATWDDAVQSFFGTLSATKRAGIGSCILLVLVAGAVLWRATRPDEPIYEGIPLTRWLESHVPTSSANPPFNSPGWKKADKALRQIGTNAIPTLLRMVRAKDPPPVILRLIDAAQQRGLAKQRYRRAYQRTKKPNMRLRCWVPTLSAQCLS